MNGLADRVAAENPFKAALAKRQRQFGFWCAMPSNLYVEVIADAGFDWELMDGEHAPNDIQSLIGQLQAMRGSPTHAVARPTSNDPVAIRQLLDIGFRSLMIPYVQSAGEAAQAVSATRYPPHGVRGVSGYHRNNAYGRVPDYFQFIDQAVCVLAQIETPVAAAALEEIGRVPGVDALFVGPGDLAASLGHIGQAVHPEVQAVIQDIGQRAAKAGICAGIVAGTPADAQRYLGWGFSFMTVSSDIATFRTGMSTLVNSLSPLRN